MSTITHNLFSYNLPSTFEQKYVLSVLEIGQYGFPTTHVTPFLSSACTFFPILKVLAQICESLYGREFVTAQHYSILPYAISRSFLAWKLNYEKSNFESIENYLT